VCGAEQTRPRSGQPAPAARPIRNAVSEISAAISWRFSHGTSLDDTAGMPEQRTPRVLVADDQADIVTALRLLLRGAGLDADAADSVQEVRTRLRDAEYDLLLMDLNYARDTTSGREGLDLLTEVHAHDPLLPVVVMTGWGTIDTAVEAMRRGARTFITKPWDNAALVDAVRRELDDGRASRHEDRRASREQDDAQAIQRALLPVALPELHGCEMAARWKAASAFGGDSYDAWRLDEDRVAISIADVCGKGLPAALVMANLQASVRAFGDPTSRPREVAASVNAGLAQHAGLLRFVTFFYAVYDAATHTLTFTNAGHNPPVVVRADGSVTRLTAGGMVMGVMPNPEFEEGTIRLAPGDRVVLFTDGITEAEAAGGEPFDDVAAFTGGAFQDDATVLALAIRG
jgi:sigma-B regulation protein RsbU (phosphoserine phosphatase)